MEQDEQIVNSSYSGIESENVKNDEKKPEIELSMKSTDIQEDKTPVSSHKTKTYNQEKKPSTNQSIVQLKSLDDGKIVKDSYRLTKVKGCGTTLRKIYQR